MYEDAKSKTKKRKKEKGNGPKMIRNKSWVFFFNFSRYEKGNLDKLYMNINWMMYEYKQG